MINVARLIDHKRQGGRLEQSEIHQLIQGYTRGDVPDYQMSAMAMAVCFVGLDAQELLDWTVAMRDSGEVLRWEGVAGPFVDKHSTGGVGDKVSLVLGPLCAAAGLRVPMISGRALGHTGGTLDKLESIPGFDAGLSLARLREVVAGCGVAITGQTRELAPADQKLYALRDVTGTVASLGLITASILSKKLAEGLDALVMDVKVGNGAFMKDLDSARALATQLVQTGSQLGVKVRALLTDMSQPLGNTIGNALELGEAIEALQGGGPADLRALTCELAAEMLVMGGRAADLEAGRELAARHLDDGSGLAKLREMVAAQGGDVGALSAGRLSRTYHEETILAPKDGYVVGFDCAALGQVAMDLGAGRAAVGAPVRHGVGIKLHVKRGARVEQCDSLMTLCSDRTDSVDELLRRALGAVKLGKEAPAEAPLVWERL